MYKVIDYYDNVVKGDLIAVCEAIQDARHIAREYADDCDGECAVVIRDENGREYTY